MPLVERYFYRFTEGREGNREKRQPLMFDTGRDGFIVAVGARATPGGAFLRHPPPEQHKATDGFIRQLAHLLMGAEAIQ